MKKLDEINFAFEAMNGKISTLKTDYSSSE